MNVSDGNLESSRGIYDFLSITYTLHTHSFFIRFYIALSSPLFFSFLFFFGSFVLVLFFLKERRQREREGGREKREREREINQSWRDLFSKIYAGIYNEHGTSTRYLQPHLHEWLGSMQWPGFVAPQFPARFARKPNYLRRRRRADLLATMPGLGADERVLSHDIASAFFATRYPLSFECHDVFAGVLFRGEISGTTNFCELTTHRIEYATRWTGIEIIVARSSDHQK